MEPSTTGPGASNAAIDVKWFTSPSERRFLGLLLLVSGLSAATQVPQIDVSPQWIGGDYAQYLMHARNLVEGRPFEDTPYLYNPENPSLGPRAYPPGWPILMAPVYAAFDGALAPIRVLSLCYFVACLLLAGLLLRSYLPDPAALAGTALVGLNPQLRPFAAGLGSDVPFLFFLLWSLHALGKREEDERWTRSVLLGVLFFGAFAIRTVGGLLVPAVILADLAQRRRIRRSTWLALAVFMTLALVETLLTSGSGSYLDQFHPTAGVLAANATDYARAFSGFWETGLEHVWAGEWVRQIFTLTCLVLIAIGYLYSLRERATALEFFVPLYVALIVAWPAHQGLRFLIPLFPPAILYLIVGASRLARSIRLAPALGMGAVIAMPLLVYGTYDPLRAPAVDMRHVDDAPSSELFAFLRALPDDVVLIFDRPRILALMTGHRAAANHQPRSDTELHAFLFGIGATHLVLGPPELGGREYLQGFIARNAQAHRLLFANDVFQVFEIVQ